MTKELARKYYSNFVMDPMLFDVGMKYVPYVYSELKSDERVERYARLGRIFMAVMLDDQPIVKNIDHTQKTCMIGISLVNDNYKNMGYGTEAEIQTLMHLISWEWKQFMQIHCCVICGADMFLKRLDSNQRIAMVVFSITDATKRPGDRWLYKHENNKSLFLM